MSERFIPPETIHNDPYETRLYAARVLSDRATEAGLPVDFLAAHEALFLVNGLERLPLVPFVPGESSATAIEPTAFFYLAEALDLLMTHGDPDSMKKSAMLALELHASMPHSRAAGSKLFILKNILGIESSPGTPVALHLVDRYLDPEATDEQKLAAAETMAARSRAC